jgi:hypothetical protein
VIPEMPCDQGGRQGRLMTAIMGCMHLPATSAGLARKLGIRPDDVVALVGAPPDWSAGELPEGARLRSGLRGPADIVIAFVRREADLEKVLSKVVPTLGPTDALWLAWPRKAAGHVSELGDTLVRSAALETGLVDIKVAAIGEDWSGLRFVWRTELRDTVRRRPTGRP